MLSYFKRHYCLLVSVLILLFSSPNRALANVAFSTPLEKLVVLKAENLVQFRSLGLNANSSSSWDLELLTRNEVKISTKSFKLRYDEGAGLSEDLDYSSNPAAKVEYDPWYKETREFLSSGSIITIKHKKTLSLEAKLYLEFEACNNKLCLLPALFELSLKPGAIALVLEEAPLKKDIFEPKKLDLIAKTKDSSIADLATEYLAQGGFLLLPLLFLAGLLMNLTPCVYPMIPITLATLAKINKSNSNKIIWPLVYVLSMSFAYSIMGLFAGLTGNFFGAILQNQLFNVFLGIVFIFLAITMLGLIDLSKIQNLILKIELDGHKPFFKIAFMGALSGVISAPCTGPVLASILLIISQAKEPLRGFVYMLIFSLGFGLPYLILGIFATKITKMPKIGLHMELIKIIFASLIFALALYYLRLSLNGYLGFVYDKPQIMLVLIVGVLTLLTFFLWKHLVKKASDLSYFFKSILVVCLFVLANWGTLYVLKAFLAPEATYLGETDWNTATTLAKSQNKILIVDIWADWCTSCKEMDDMVWNTQKFKDFVEEHAIFLKINFSQQPDIAKKILKRWHLGGLPAVAIFAKSSDYANLPIVLWREKVSLEVLITTAQQHVE